jgi:hypothetical protein
MWEASVATKEKNIILIIQAAAFFKTWSSPEKSEIISMTFPSIVYPFTLSLTKRLSA